MHHPTGRVLAVLELLQSRSLVSGTELAERLEMDPRTIRRYIAKLQDVGIPAESVPGRFGGYRLRPGYRMPPLVLSEDEAIAVVAGLIGSSWMNLSLPGSAVESTLSKIARVLPKTTWDRVQSLTTVSVLPQESGGRHFSAATVIQMSRAAAEQSCIRLVYEAQETTERTVEPYGVVGFQGRWYMVGFCRLRKAVRVFRLDRVSSCTVLAEQFQPPKNFDSERYIKERLEEAQRWKIRIRFDSSEDEIRLLFGAAGEITPTDDGHEYAGPASDLDFTARALLFSGLSFHILEPPELKVVLARIADKARKLSE